MGDLKSIVSDGPRKKGGPKQGEIKGTERKRDKQLDRLAREVYDTTAERLKVQKDEADARSRLLLAMQKKGVKRYEFVDGAEALTVTREETEKVSVKKTREGD